MKLGILSSHPIQYQAPWFRELAKLTDLTVYFAHRPNPQQQGTGFGQAITWDVDLLSGYKHIFLHNRSTKPSTDTFNGCSTPDIANHITEEQFDAFIVTGWYLRCFWQAIRGCRRQGIPVLVRGDSQLHTPSSSLRVLVKRFLYPRLLDQFDGFLIVGKRNAEYLRHYGVPESKLFFAPHFIDNQWFADQAQKQTAITSRLLQQWGVNESTLVIGFVGKFIDKKRPIDVLKAAQQLPPDLSWKLIYVGSGPLENSLRQQAKASLSNVIFTGFKNQSELPAYYAAVDVLVLPSDGGETWGLVVNEAMACGTPAIVSNSCGCSPDMIDEGQTGYIFQTDNLSQLTQALQNMASKKISQHDWTPALATKLERYSLEECVAGTMQTLTMLTRQKH